MASSRSTQPWPWRFQQRRETCGGLRNVGVGNGKQRTVAPHVQRAGGDCLAREAAARIVKVEDNFKWRKTILTDGERLVAIALAALPTSQFISRRHSSLSIARAPEREA